MLSIYKASGRFVCEFPANELRAIRIGLPVGAYELCDENGARVCLFIVGNE